MNLKKYQLHNIYWLLLLLWSNSVYSALDPDTDRIHLRKDCTSFINCTSLPNEMVDWVNLDRTDINGLAVVEIGPGEFVMSASKTMCEGAKNVSYRGSGREITVFTGGGTSIINGNKPSVISFNNCDNLSFQDFSVRSDSWSNGTASGSLTGIEWKGAGNSVWSNIDVQATFTGWYDDLGLHYWYGSKLSVRSSGVENSAAYYSKGGEGWFYGGELEAVHDNTSSIINSNSVLMNGGEIRIFGSAVRATATANAGTIGSTFGFAGILVAGNGTAHMHGGIVSVHGGQMVTNQDVYGVRTTTALGGNQKVHMVDTAFAISAGGNGMALRINGPGIDSPFHWPAGFVPPSIKSDNGQDVFVEKDCADNGNCSGTGSEKHPHIMLYDDTCVSNGPWFNATLGRCRGLTN